MHGMTLYLFLLFLKERNKGEATSLTQACTVSSVSGLIVILSEAKMETKKKGGRLFSSASGKSSGLVESLL